MKLLSTLLLKLLNVKNKKYADFVKCYSFNLVSSITVDSINIY